MIYDGKSTLSVSCASSSSFVSSVFVYHNASTIHFHSSRRTLLIFVLNSHDTISQIVHSMLVDLNRFPIHLLVISVHIDNLA